ncbi:hypothetical protein E2986_11813 [Frieseomelitta varia]|uniref:Uncharacterized protein n=1 Tax=Frieseomelitta varia TaxID=561572 RepID=A0A833RVG4_9HYME|nr:hypothetical protein E2986_11813 [Frieseomelitta varia]
MIFQIAFLCIYIVYVMVQLYLYCYVGEKLTVESIDIADTAYHCEWYNLPPKDAGLLIIIMCRATSSPLKLTAGKFCCFTILLYSQAKHGHSQRGVPLRVVQFTSQGREITDNYYVPSESITVETYSRQILLVHLYQILILNIAQKLPRNVQFH